MPDKKRKKGMLQGIYRAEPLSLKTKTKQKDFINQWWHLA